MRRSLYIYMYSGRETGQLEMASIANLDIVRKIRIGQHSQAGYCEENKDSRKIVGKWGGGWWLIANK